MMGRFTQKTKELIIGKRRLRDRLLTGFAPALALSFTLFCFGPLDLAVISQNFVSWSPFVILRPVALLWAAAFFALWLGISLPGGKVHAVLLSLVSGIALAAYVQGAFLNLDLGALDGHVIPWEKYTGKALLNLTVWSFIVTLPFILRHYSRPFWRTSLILVCSTLTLMQAVSLGVKLTEQSRIDAGKAGDYVLETSDALTLGQEENVLVFLLDTTSAQDVRDMERDHPNSLYPFRDFTWFDNCAGEWLYTFPSILGLLTGETYLGDVPIHAAMEKAWQSDEVETFYGMLAEKGFERILYMNPAELTADMSLLAGRFDNVKERGSAGRLNRSAFKSLLKLSLYRYFPLIMKAPFWIYTEDIASMMGGEGEMPDAWSFVTRYNREGLSLGDGKRRFSFFYTQGSHFPWLMNEEGKMVYQYDSSSYTTQSEQLRGHFNLLASLFGQLKELGLYDDTTIFVLSDHGNNENDERDPMPLFMVKPAGQSQEAITVDSRPIVLQEQFIPTVTQLLGGESAGISAFDAPVADRERCSRLFLNDPSLPDLNSGRFNAYTEYCWNGDGRVLQEMIKQGEGTLRPLTDSFY